ncbi:MAG: hypothetical protein KIT31_23265 [Deltaproteobacteria bacterium]|nr:hypothetical protein [Deltaproteobacteria bacterium]
MRRMIAAVVVLAAAGGTARARGFRGSVDRFQGGAFLHYELTGLSVVDEGATPARAHEVVLAGARLHGFVGQNASVNYHIGFDVAVGGAFSLPGRSGGAGFAYDVALFPIGVVVRGGRTSIIGFSAGIGASGATGVLDDAMTFPLETFAEVGGGRLRLLARARATYIAFADNRQSAAPSIAFADELEGMLALRVGRHFEDFGFPSGNGGFVGVAYKEIATARMVGLVVGYSIDMATPRRWRDKARQERQEREDRRERERRKKRPRPS